MKANEFFKKVGVEAVKSYIAAYEDHLTDDLKRLVESHELVESLGGFGKAYLRMQKAEKDNHPVMRDLIKQAMADVESCQ